MRFPFPRSNRATWILAAALAVVAIVVAGIAYHELSGPKNTLNRSAAFVTTPTQTVTTRKPSIKHTNFTWPVYGYTDTRTRDFTGDANLDPPFRRSWKYTGNALLEFPAAIYRNFLYFMDDGATVKDVNANSGKRIWLTHVGKQSAATPALDTATQQLFVPVLSIDSSEINARNGEFAALSMKTGHIQWTVPIPSGTESSPVVVGHSVYFGDQGGTEYSLDIRTGHVNWSYQTGGAIKAGADYYDGMLFFGNYAGQFYALDARTGKVVWEESPGGEFYSTPAVAYGRVYVGNNSGAAYSFVAKDGTEAWSRSLGGYVYSGPAVADVPGLGYTVFIGSYDGYLYALNAQTGATEWDADTATPGVTPGISGSATVINHTVYVSTVYAPGTYGFNTRTGKKVFSFPDGSYTPVVAEPNALFLMGKYVIYKFLPEH